MNLKKKKNMDRPHPYGPNDLWEKNSFIERVKQLDIKDPLATILLAKELYDKRSYSYQSGMLNQIKINLGREQYDPAIFNLESMDIYIDKDRIPAEWREFVVFHGAAELIYLIKLMQEKGFPLLEQAIKLDKSLIESAHQNALALEYKDVEGSGLDEYQQWIREFYQLAITEEKKPEAKSNLEKRLSEREGAYKSAKAGIGKK